MVNVPEFDLNDPFSLPGEEKKNLTVAELMDLFHKNSGQVLNDDALVLG